MRTRQGVKGEVQHSLHSWGGRQQLVWGEAAISIQHGGLMEGGQLLTPGGQLAAPWYVVGSRVSFWPSLDGWGR